MLVIRLSRTGKRNSPSFRVVVQEKHRTPTGKAVEFLGYYNPRLKEKRLKTDRIEYWLEKGAQPSGSIHNLLVTEGILKAGKVKVSRLHPKKKKAESDETVASQEKEAVTNQDKETKDSKKEEVAQQEPAPDTAKEKPAEKEVSSEAKESQPEAKKEKKDQPKASPKDDQSAKS